MSRLIDADALLDGLEDLFKRRELNAACTGNRGSAVTWNDAIFAIKSAPTASDWDRYSKKLWEEAYERGKRDAQPEVAKDINVPSTDCISRKAAIDAICAEWCANYQRCGYRASLHGEKFCDGCDDIEKLKELPSAQPDLPEAYAKKVWTWLLGYQTTAAELKAKYSAYEVLSWVVNDWRRGHGGLN